MRIVHLIVLLLLASCQDYSEQGGVSVTQCPRCESVYDNFEKCSFFEVYLEYARPFMLVDDEFFHGVGQPIKQAGFMHHKFCFNQTHAITGSANPTSTGLNLNDNIVVEFESAIMASNFASEFGHLLGKRSKVRNQWLFNNATIKQYFCPRDNCEDKVIQELSTANESIRFLTFAFTSDPIGQLLTEKIASGVLVEGVYDSLGTGMRGSEYNRLKDAGANIHVRSGRGVMHIKAFIIDDSIVIFGSYNPTAQANTRNAENIVITSEPSIVRAYLHRFSLLTNQ